MPHNFGALAFTPLVKAEQEKHGSLQQYNRIVAQGPDTNRFGPAEKDFIEARDGFYLSSVGETGWPYIQFRGGPSGFLHVVDPQTLAFADFRGNRQYITTGNLLHDDRVALFLMDYAHQARLKILGRAKIVEGKEAEPLINQLRMPDYPAKIERVVWIHLEAFDWNCQQHIPPRYTLPEIEQAVAPLRKRIAELEAQLHSETD